ncbi:unnamed protein product, partial [Brassica oleracea]
CSLIQQSSSSLNARSLPRPSSIYFFLRHLKPPKICKNKLGSAIIQQAMTIEDKKSLEFALSVWKSNRDRLIGWSASILGKDEVKDFYAVRAADLRFSAEPCGSITRYAKDLIRGMLWVDPS